MVTRSKQIARPIHWQSSLCDTSFDREARRKAIVHWLCNIEARYFIVLAFNRETDLIGGTKALGAFFAHTDRWLLGPRWWRKRTGRTLMVCIPENLRSNTHWNLYGTLPQQADELKEAKLRAQIDEIWRGLIPAGSTSCKPITEHKRLARYIAKQTRRPDVFHGIVVSSQFWPTVASAT